MMKRYQILSGSALKFIALITMTIDHTAAIILSQMPFAFVPLMTIGSETITVYFLCRLVGRTAFPLYCFLIAEGYVHTHNRKRYGADLLLFAFLSEIPWNLEHTGGFLYPAQNVFFTLFLGFLAICLYEAFKEKPVRCFLLLATLVTAAILIKADYGAKGVALILLLYVLRERRAVSTALGCCFFADPWKVMPSFALMNLYNGKRGLIQGKIAKYAFYAFYPVHILILYGIRAACFGY